MEFELELTITVVLQVNRLTRCDSHPNLEPTNQMHCNRLANCASHPISLKSDFDLTFTKFKLQFPIYFVANHFMLETWGGRR